MYIPRVPSKRTIHAGQVHDQQSASQWSAKQWSSYICSSSLYMQQYVWKQVHLYPAMFSAPVAQWLILISHEMVPPQVVRWDLHCGM
jgi:hypothetical protein